MKVLINDFEDTVAVVEIDDKGITSIDAGILSLKEMLEDIRDNGVAEIGGGAVNDGQITDGVKFTKVTVITVGLLVRAVERSGPYEAVVLGGR